MNKSTIDLQEQVERANGSTGVCVSRCHQIAPCHVCLNGDGGGYVEIEVIRSEGVKCLLQTLRNIRLVGIPQLASNENILARNTAIFDALTDFVFVSY